MKKFMKILLTIFVFISCFFISSCEKRELVTIQVVNEGKPEVSHVDGDSHIKFHVKVAEGYDVADLVIAEVKFYFDKKEDTPFRAFRSKKAIVPENARGNPDMQYLTVVLKNIEIPLDQWVQVTRITASIDANKVGLDLENDTIKRVRTPSIFMTFIIGIIAAVVGFGLVLFGLNFFGDNFANIVLVAGIVGPLGFVIWSFLDWGMARGIILSIFYVLLVVATIYVVKKIDEY